MLRRYKVQFRATWNDWRQCDDAVLEISLKPNVADMINAEKLRDSLDKLRKSMGNASIALIDTLHRYDFLNYTCEGAYQHTRELGDAWMEQNRSYIEDTSVQRWDDILEHPSFAHRLQDVEKLESEDQLFREALNTDVNRFFQKKARSKVAEKASLCFLKEETAGFLAFGEGRRMALFYHGTPLASMTYAFDQLGLDAAKCSIRCNRLKNPYSIATIDHQQTLRLRQHEHG